MLTVGLPVTSAARQVFLPRKNWIIPVNLHTFKPGLIRIISIAILVHISACTIDSQDLAQQISSNIHPTQLPIPAENLPEFIISVSPIGLSSAEKYNLSLETDFPLVRGIVITVRADKIGVISENDTWKSIGDSVLLYIDGKRISQDFFRIANGAEQPYGPLYLSWGPQLESGAHDANFQITTDAGNILEFTWQFVLAKEFYP